MQQLQRIIKECINNNRSAQLELYKIFAPMMLGVCYRYTKSKEDAEDVLQEGFIRVYQNLKQFKNEGDLGAWIRRIMVNCAITYLQKHNRYKKYMGLEEVYLHPVTDENPEISLDTKDLVEMIRQLPSGYQTIFNLIGVEGYNAMEVSSLLNINVNTVRSQYSRSRSLLMQHIRHSRIGAEQTLSYAGSI